MDLTSVGDAVGTGGPWVAVVGLILAGARAIMSGALVPRATVDMVNAQWEARLAESIRREQDWKQAYENEAAAGDLRDQQVAKLVTSAEIVDRVLSALPSQPGKG